MGLQQKQHEYKLGYADLTTMRQIVHLITKLTNHYDRQVILPEPSGKEVNRIELTLDYTPHKQLSNNGLPLHQNSIITYMVIFIV